MIRRLLLVVLGALTAAMATLAAFWATRRPQRGGGTKRAPRAGSATAASTSAGSSAARASAASAGSPGPAETGPAASGGAATEPGGTPAAEDLRTIKGLGAVSEERLRDIGITSLAQIAGWSDEDIDAIAERLKLSAERIRREDWVGQARSAAG